MRTRWVCHSCMQLGVVRHRKDAAADDVNEAIELQHAQAARRCYDGTTMIQVNPPADVWNAVRSADVARSTESRI